MSIVKVLNAAPLTPKLMKGLMLMLDAMPSEERSDLARRGNGIIRFLQEHHPDHDPLNRHRSSPPSSFG
jgi:hypothetical protein